MDDKEQIIDKILKIYNKSKNNPSEHEAKAAVLKVQGMLAKHNLKLKDLQLEDKQDVKKISSGQKSRWWHGILGNILSRNFKCKMYIQTYNGKTLVFVGKETDVNVCVQTFEYVKHSVNYSCKIHMSKRRLKNKENIKIAKESFIDGFIRGLDYELEKQKNSNQWGLVLSIPVEVHEFYSKIEFTGVTKWEKNHDNKMDEKAFQDGYVKGKELNINPNKILIS